MVSKADLTKKIEEIETEIANHRSSLEQCQKIGFDPKAVSYKQTIASLEKLRDKFKSQLLTIH